MTNDDSSRRTQSRHPLGPSTPRSPSPDGVLGQSIVITGFMGTGKTSVGAEVARRLGRPFVDMDETIERRVGLTVAQIFAQYGENHFRQQESALCRELAGRSGLVVATGGGTLISPQNRERFLQASFVVRLVCTEAEILRRLDGVQDRPLLDTVNREQLVRELASSRQEAYAQLPHHVDTSGRSIGEVVDAVIDLYEGEESARNEAAGRWVEHFVHTPRGGYRVLLERGILEQLGGILREQGFCAPVVVVTNSTVAALYADKVVTGLRKNGLAPQVVEVPDGEAYKTLDTVRQLYDQFIAAGLERSSPVLTLGGGVIGDLAGFAAATYMRGVPLVHAPTTLLAMVDSSIGGKVAVDLPWGKNLVGAFKQPHLVVTDPEVLSTLSEPEFHSGLAEVVKAALVGSPALFSHLEERGTEDLLWMISEAIRVKVAVVEEDPYEHGRRAVLNLGHTFGHALEVLSGYRMRHGEAVSIGLVIAVKVAARSGLCADDLEERLTALLRKFGLPTSYGEFTPKQILAAMRTDKKRQGGRLRFILPQEIGAVVVTDEITEEAILSALAEVN